MANLTAALAQSFNTGRHQAGGDATRLRKKKARVLGGPGSGNFGHSGRPGEVGGSGAGSGVSERGALPRGSLISTKKLDPAVEEIVFGQKGVLEPMAKRLAKTLGQPVNITLRSGLDEGGGSKLTMTIVGQKDDNLKIVNTYGLTTEGALEVHHSLIELPKEAQGAGLGKKILQQELDDYDRIGADRVTLLANIDVGSYAWAKYGYTLDPSVPESDPVNFSDRMYKHLSDSGLPEELKERVQKIIDDHTSRDGKTLDPHVIWALADMKDGDQKTGADVLIGKEKTLSTGKKEIMGFDWDGLLDLHDQTAMARVRKYIGSTR